MADLLQELESLKEVINSSRTKRDELQGEQSKTIRDMKAKFEVSDVQEASDLLENLRKQREKLQTKLDSGFAKVKEEFEW